MLRPALAALLALALLPGAGGFSPVPGGPHDDITRAAARLAGYPDGGVDALVAAVLAPDAEDAKPGLGEDGVKPEKTDSYAPEHHCDRAPAVPDLDAFNATVGYVRSQADEARNASLAQDAEGAVRALGRALHALEDCFSHSNAIDLEEPTVVVHAVVGNVPPPAGLRLTGVDPDGDDLERPPGDDYSHADFAKDSAEKNDESKVVMADNRTKFEAARDLAIDAAALFLEGWLEGRNAAEAGELGEVDAPDGGLVPRWAPALPPAVAVAVLALAGAALARRR